MTGCCANGRLFAGYRPVHETACDIGQYAVAASLPTDVIDVCVLLPDLLRRTLQCASVNQEVDMCEARSHGLLWTGLAGCTVVPATCEVAPGVVPPNGLVCR